MKTLGIIFIMNLSALISCKSHMPATENTAVTNNTQSDNPGTGISNNVEPENTVQNDSAPKTQPKDFVYRFIVTFISIGEGTDAKAFETLQSYLEEWKTARKKDIHYDKFPWGREGEVDLGFSLSELDAAQQKQFITEVKNKFNGNKLVQFAENEPCRHRR